MEPGSELAWELYAGIDEAGRGPIVGPLIIAGVVISGKCMNKLSTLGVKDSKQLTKAQREKLIDVIYESARYIIIAEIPPHLIDAYNINMLEEDTIAYLVSRIVAVNSHLKLKEISIDAVGSSKQLAQKIREVVPKSVRVVIEEKADRKYVAVSAASIVAKVWRDRRIDALKTIYGNFGSGYPTDPNTRRWIHDMYSLDPYNPPPIIRRTWGTLKTLAPLWYKKKRQTVAGKEKTQKTLADFLPKI